jgi:hypothetical protein
LDTAKEISKKKLGALFVVSPKNQFKGLYEPLYPQAISSSKIFDKGANELIIKLAELDGAFLIGDDGEIIAFGARIKKSKALPGYGTKHAAARGMTKHISNSTAILISEENNWIKVFKKGQIILELDSNENTPEPITKKIVSLITDNDTALIATAGISAALTGFIPVVVVSGTYLVIKTTSGIIKKSLKGI